MGKFCVRIIFFSIFFTHTVLSSGQKNVNIDMTRENLNVCAALIQTQKSEVFLQDLIYTGRFD